MKQGYSRKMLAFLLAFAMVLTSFVSIGTSAKTASAKAKATLKLNKTKASVAVGGKVTLKVTKKNVKKIKSKTFTSSKKAVASVTKKGVVTGKKEGKATIKVKVKYIAKGAKKTASKTLKCVVTVKKKGNTDNPSVTPTSAPAATADPATVILTKILTPDDISLRVKSDDTSNIGAEREITYSDGTKQTVKDNGTMRTELDSQYLADNEMGQGINLGNTLEATYGYDKKASISGSQFDTAWGNAPTTQELIDRIHSYGINTIRIPVAWTNGDTEDGTFTIRDAFLDRVEEVVNYALNDGMYVVINDHWDNGWWGEFGACKRVDAVDENGNPILKADGTVKQTKVADEEWRAKAWERLERYWTQIAERFKGYSDHLIFEVANEELCTRLNDTIYASTGYSSTVTAGEVGVSGNLKGPECYDVTNRINQKFVDIVRSTGGNNANRHLLIAGYTTDLSATLSDAYKMPTDTEENGKTKLFLSIHYYTPWSFCGDGMTGVYTLQDQMSTKTFFEGFKKFSDAGYAVILGECGIVTPTGVNASVSQWLNDTFTESAKYHIVPCLWDQGAYFNRKEATLRFKDIADLYNTVCGANGDATMSTYTGYVEIESVDVSKMTPVWSWEGRWYKNGGDYIVGDDKYSDNPVDAHQVDVNVEGFEKEFANGETTKTIDGDTTEIVFDATGFQSFLKVDLDKIKNPVLEVRFLDGTLTKLDKNGEVESSIGLMQLGAAEEAKFTQDALVGEEKILNHQGIDLISGISSLKLTDAKPWLSIAFTNAPIVTGIYLYDKQ